MTGTNKNMDDMEKLFLLELLVDSVQVDYGKFGLGKNDIAKLKQACIRFQFFNYPPLEICEEDFCKTPDDYTKEKIEFKCGKSCLFSLRGIPPDIRSFDICVSVHRLSECVPPIHLGKTRISLGSSFTNLLTALENDASTGSHSRTSKDTHPLFNDEGEVVGKITAFIRLSCFGKTIITEFQVSGEENKSFLFKQGEAADGEGVGDTAQNTVSDPYIRDNSGTAAGDASIRGLCNQDAFHGKICEDRSQYQGNTIGQGCTADWSTNIQGNPPQKQDPSFNALQCPDGFAAGMGYQDAMRGNQFGASTNQFDMLGHQFGPPINQFAPLGHQLIPPSFQPGLPGYPLGGVPGTGNMGDTPDKNFKEIGVEINGHSLTIKVPKKKKKKSLPVIPVKPPSPETSSDSEDEIVEGPQQGDAQFCSCDVPLPPGFGSPQPVQKKKKKKNKNTADKSFCMRPDCPMGFPMPLNVDTKAACSPFVTPPGAIGVQGDQVVFQMPAGNQVGFNTNPKAQYKLGGPPDSNLQKIQMMTDSQAAVTGAPDPMNDMFLLKVGKKNCETGRRTMMNVEVKSPRKKETKTIDEQTQWEEIGGGGQDKKKKGDNEKGKGKGGKGKGKKK